MRIGKSVAMLMVLALVGMAVPMIGMADNLSAKAVLTFSQPVEIPGVVLPAGTYVFKFDDVKDLAQIWDVEENRIYATVMTTVSYVAEPPRTTMVTLGERAASAPQALTAIIEANQSISHELAYPAVTRH